jgi:hypothetical protein
MALRRECVSCMVVRRCQVASTTGVDVDRVVQGRPFPKGRPWTTPVETVLVVCRIKSEQK